MVNAVPRQMFATTTETTASLVSDSQATGPRPTEPSAEFTSPYGPSLSTICQITPTSTPGITQAVSTTERTSTAPCSLRATARCMMSATARPSPSWPATEAATKIAVTASTPGSAGSVSVCENVCSV